MQSNLTKTFKIVISLFLIGLLGAKLGLKNKKPKENKTIIKYNLEQTWI